MKARSDTKVSVHSKLFATDKRAGAPQRRFRKEYPLERERT